MIKYIEINEKKYDFSKKTFITSMSNSSGKTTLIRSILFGLGFIVSDSYVDGSILKNIKIKVKIEIFNKKLLFVRTKNRLSIYNKNYLNKEFKINDKDYIKNLEAFFEMMSGGKKSIIRLFLFSNYIDQQFGNHAINRGKIGLFPEKFQFNLNEITRSIEKDLQKKFNLQKKVEQLNKFEKDLAFMASYSNIKKSRMQLDLFKNKDINKSLRNLLIKLERLKFKKKIQEEKKIIIPEAVNKLLKMNLVYKTKSGDLEKLSMDNLKDGSIKINTEIITSEINFLENSIKKLKEEIEDAKQIMIKDGLSAKMIEVSIYNQRLRANAIEISEEELSQLFETKKVWKNEIKKIEEKMKLSFYNEIENNFLKYLNHFNTKENQLDKLIEKIKNKDYSIISETSKWMSYVGAIRFAIGSSLKFAISDFLLKNKIQFPIIIDKLYHEELDPNMKNKYKEILLNRKEQIIISNIDQPFDDMSDFRTIKLAKDIFDENQINLFSLLS